MAYGDGGLGIEVRNGAGNLQDPIMVEVARPNALANNVEQHFYSVPTDDKRRAVLKLPNGALKLEAEGLISVILLPTPRGLVVAQKREGRT